MGLVDGPGIRTVVFLQGCRLRCRYCHNPDTWALTGGESISPEALVRRLVRFKPYYGSEGGVTFSGGEPLLQPEFLLQTLRLCKEAGIGTCLDTAGCGAGDYDAILRLTDLVLLDVKHEDAAGYRAVTGAAPDGYERFLAAARRAGTPLWLRHVVVPGLTDGEEHLQALRAYVRGIPNVRRVQLLCYHTLGVHKYAALGIPYTLADTPPLAPGALDAWQRLFDADTAARGAAAS